METSKSMLIFTSAWGPQGGEKPTFRMMPITLDCPYTECIFDPTNNVLAVISKIAKQSYTMVPKINEEGDLQLAKRVRSNGKQYKEERRLMDSYQEFYIEDPDEIHAFVEMFGVNVASWNERIRKFLTAKPAAVPPGKITMVDPKQVDLEDSIAEVEAEKQAQEMSVVPKD